MKFLTVDIYIYICVCVCVCVETWEVARGEKT
jgi:hypothetical protein